MAGFHLCFFVVLLALAIVAESTSPAPRDFQLPNVSHISVVEGEHLVGHVGDYINPMEEMMMESEFARRNLAGGSHISYDALKANKVPCSKRGQSYYNCQQSGRANPYNRGCTAATRCARH
ncbi:Rapid ALkalinization Factor [Heracleum sosnowskyi]|uniref:Rapid ALkalinization Factor n=1 Tax=Heracleum sosnowskyi TaxID=360622 RepID=A0AAD8JK57_9APIA|nr:Rapid ALkalinization Factor [Heracleum sosnowskyi]